MPQPGKDAGERVKALLRRKATYERLVKSTTQQHAEQLVEVEAAQSRLDAARAKEVLIADEVKQARRLLGDTGAECREAIANYRARMGQEAADALLEEGLYD